MLWFFFVATQICKLNSSFSSKNGISNQPHAKQTSASSLIVAEPFQLFLTSLKHFNSFARTRSGSQTFRIQMILTRETFSGSKTLSVGEATFVKYYSQRGIFMYFITCPGGNVPCYASQSLLRLGTEVVLKVAH